MKTTLKIAVLLFAVGLLVSCTDLGYYLQCAKGHMDVMARTRSIDELIGDPQTSPEVRQELNKVVEIRNFAVSDLGLPDNDSYRNYADIGRPYVIWNVVAAPEFSLAPQQWCFPVAGCVSYRGYFNQASAEDLASRLKQDGLDVDIYGVQAYSTLRWFSDPVLNTFLATSDARLAGLIFHELAHQVVYVAGDSSFNEAFAKTVEMEGVRRWYQRHATAGKWQQYLSNEQQAEVFQDFLKAASDRLSTLYSRPISKTEMRQAKSSLIEACIAEYQQLKNTGQLDNRFDNWMKRGLNNARLASIATYRDLVPGFQEILNECHGDFGCFYEKVRQLSELSRPERFAKLKGLQHIGHNKRPEKEAEAGEKAVIPGLKLPPT